jgi:hypothetical protein
VLIGNAASEICRNGGERWQKTKLNLPLSPQFPWHFARSGLLVNLFAQQIGKIALVRENNLPRYARDLDSGG